MALFKQFHGTEKELNITIPIQEGRNYFLTDSGKMFIDTANERICLNAEEADIAGALKKGTDEELTADNIMTKDETVGVANGGTGASDTKTARTNLSIDKAVAMVVTLPLANWIEVEGKQKQSVTLSSLVCGQGGNVPPVISPAVETSSTNFALLESVEADVESKTLIVIAKGKPNADLSIVVTDHQ